MRRVLPLLAVCLLLTGCGPTLLTIPRFHSPPAQESLVENAYRLLLNGYVTPPDPSVLALAAATGMRDAVAQQASDGVAAAFPYEQFWGNADQISAEIAQQYVVATQRYPAVDRTALAYDAISRMAQSLNDCHTQFFTPAQYQEQQAEINGTVQFGGIGASLRDRPDGPPLVGEVFSGLPAAKAGLKPGDAIERVNGTDVQGMSAKDVVTLIRGPVGSVVQLDVQRAGAGTLHFAITRADVTPPSLNAGLLHDNAGNQIAYIQIFSFSPDMPDQLQGVLQQIAQRNIQLWVVDLRDDPGGTVDALQAAASMFVPQGGIATFQSRDGKTQALDVTGDAVNAPHRLVVLVNDGSASASEMFAAAVQEHQAGVVIGTRTAGCVAVGEMHRLADGSAIEFAADKVFTPVQHRTLNGAGVTPNVSISMSLDDLAAGHDPQLLAAEQLLINGQVAGAAATPGAPDQGVPTPPAVSGSGA